MAKNKILKFNNENKLFKEVLKSQGVEICRNNIQKSNYEGLTSIGQRRK